LFHIARYSREYPGIFEFNDMLMVEPMLCHRRFVWISEPYVQVVLFYSGLYRFISVSDVHLITHAGYAVDPQSPQSQVVLHRMKETRDLPRQQATTLSVVFGQHSVEPAVCRLDICKKSNQGGLFFQLRGSNRQVEDLSYLFDTITIFLKIVFRNSNSSWRLSLSQRALALCTNVIIVCMLEGWCFDPGFRQRLVWVDFQ